MIQDMFEVLLESSNYALSNNVRKITISNVFNDHMYHIRFLKYLSHIMVVTTGGRCVFGGKNLCTIHF